MTGYSGGGDANPTARRSRAGALENRVRPTKKSTERARLGKSLHDPRIVALVNLVARRAAEVDYNRLVAERNGSDPTTGET